MPEFKGDARTTVSHVYLARTWWVAPQIGGGRCRERVRAHI